MSDEAMQKELIELRDIIKELDLLERQSQAVQVEMDRLHLLEKKLSKRMDVISAKFK